MHKHYDELYSDNYSDDTQPARETIEDLTLSKIMGERMDVWVKKANNGYFDIEIDNEMGESIVNDRNIHKAAMDSLAYFCERYLYIYRRVKGASHD